MAKISCFCVLLGGNRRKSKDMKKVAWANGNDCPKVKPVESMEGTAAAYSGKATGKATASDTKPVVAETRAESACQGLAADNGEKPSTESNVVDIIVRSPGSSGDNSSTDGADKEASPGTGVFPTVTPSRLERSCSNIETARPGWRKASGPGMALLAKSRSHDDLVSSTLARGRSIAASSPNGAPDASPTASTWSADRVMLRRRSSSQVLPSRSRKLWWRLFLWSHRNLHRPLGGGAATSASPRARAGEADVARPRQRQRDGYTSDTLETAEKKDKEIVAKKKDKEGERAIPSQWVAFSAEASAPLDRVSAWVSALADRSFDIEEDQEITEVGESSASGAKQAGSAHLAQARRRAAVDEAVQASSVVQTLNGFSSVAHISGMGLKVVPMISAFSGLRAVNLSGNFIAHIAPGSLPKGLHSLDLSRNNIATTEGLRELTRLRVLSLSYNRISRIGHGLSNCTAIRELYLAGNKISDVEGLHRLLKLAVLDLSFNKITTAKGLGQLVANYNSLRALNLLGNPVQTNIGDETLRKAVSGLLPRLEYLNKQAVKPQRAREAAKDSVAKAALGNTGWSSRRRVSRRLSHSPVSSSAKNRDREGSSSHRGSRSRSKNRPQSLSLTRR